MNAISETISNYSKDFWDFKGINKSGIHLIGKYPATMVAEMQKELLKIIISNCSDEDVTLLDPFCGSGTSLIEGLGMNLNVIGIDINPYAILLSEVKCFCYDLNEVRDSINQIVTMLDNCIKYPIHYFPNIDKWFRCDIKESLSKIRYAIQKENNILIRKFFWICLSEVIFKFSNDRTSTFKLHIKESEKIEKMENQSIEYFKKILYINSKKLNYSHLNNYSLIQGNAIKELSKMGQESISIICTSPPYGENATTVTYGQFSILPLKWIDRKDISCNYDDLLSTYSRIDYESLGGRPKKKKNIINYITINKFLNNISENKKKKVINFFEDYYLVLLQFSRVLKKGGYLLMTVGNRTIDGVQQPLDDITIEIMSSFGFNIVSSFERNIPSKKMPSRISHIKDENEGYPVNSMSEETILIFKNGE